MRSPEVRIAIRSTTFRSSRALPGHGYCCRIGNTRSSIVRDRSCCACRILPGNNVPAPEHPARSQTRNANRHNAEAIVQIFAKLTLRDHIVEIAICRGNDAHGHAYSLLSSHLMKFTFLKNSQ